jgi:hypothetical protein
MKKWFWTEPLPGTSLYPHHRRWDCRRAIIEALRWRDKPAEAAWWLGRAEAFNMVMFDCADPLAAAYAARIEKIRRAMGRAMLNR